jgi:hypothetical protein
MGGAVLYAGARSGIRSSAAVLLPIFILQIFLLAEPQAFRIFTGSYTGRIGSSGLKHSYMLDVFADITVASFCTSEVVRDPGSSVWYQNMYCPGCITTDTTLYSAMEDSLQNLDLLIRVVLAKDGVHFH